MVGDARGNDQASGDHAENQLILVEIQIYLQLSKSWVRISGGAQVLEHRWTLSIERLIKNRYLK